MSVAPQSLAPERMAGFMAHLRLNGFAVGPGEAMTALEILCQPAAGDPRSVRTGLKVLLSDRQEHWERFDELFDSYWFGRGIKRAVRANDHGFQQTARQDHALWKRHLGEGKPQSRDYGDVPQGDAEEVDDQEDREEGEPSGRLIASRQETLAKADLRLLLRAEEVAEAEAVALKLAKAMRYRLSRRRKPFFKGKTLDLRRTIRRNLSKGGEPLDLLWRRRPERPVRLVVLLDVSGSMEPYSRVFLSFLRGLTARWLETDAYLFHTRLVRITDALRDGDPLRALTRLSLLAEGFGGGTGIARSIARFNDSYARETLNSRSVVMILSDGYDTDPPADLARELARLKRRARRLVWFNPLAGWRAYEPVARGMAAALPYLDLLAPAHSLESLAALETELRAL